MATMAPPTVAMMRMVLAIAIALAPTVLCDTVCQPGAQLTFILQCAPSVSGVPAARSPQHQPQPNVRLRAVHTALGPLCA